MIHSHAEIDTLQKLRDVAASNSGTVNELKQTHEAEMGRMVK